MDPLLGVNAYAPVFNYGSYGGISSTYPAYQLLASELSLSTPGSFSNTSTLVGLSGLGQVLSATATFQDQLHPLLPGGSAGGGSDLASLTAETQSFVDAYNNLQSAIASVNNTGDLLGGNVPGASGLVQSLNAQAQAGYSNGGSALTDLSQLGITFQPSLLAGGGGSLSVDQNTLLSAFNTDAAGAFTLLSQAASAFNDLASSFIAQSSSQYSSLSALMSTGNTSITGLLTNSFLPPQLNLDSLLSTASQSGSTNLQLVFQALNEYTMVSALFG
ncbi:hypothetical protein MIZ01_1743 [Sideroxyarcus emersonii]|uniref:Flagellar hook-associated protein 2 C-terminal domain-containing protein n=1 Tax=Sideroxyarcus emersonii TaxID=2764705 RepID=A0AAN1XAZ6_9PROT|nr:flagellar filament capping protein FliD [Sideroxyarcus emersonii]BCK87946.1 hypothetical protein MIZ01_1743 [Sideroxyarcus emersonii]